jgi:GntR family transcriptional regulator
MISFDSFVMEDGSPIYTQIVRHVRRGIAAGSIRNGDEMPSRRVLSARLGINPNTVQKAYRILEDEGVIESRAGAKSYAAIDDEKLERTRSQLVESAVRAAVNAMKQMGVSKEEALRLIGTLWE